MTDKKHVSVRVTFTTELEVPADWTTDDVNFWLEGSSYCLGNIITKEYEEAEEQPGLCNFCQRACAVMLEPKE